MSHWQSLTVLTLVFQEDTALGDNDRNVAVGVACLVILHERDGNIGVSDAACKGDAKDGACCWLRRSGRWLLCQLIPVHMERTTHEWSPSWCAF